MQKVHSFPSYNMNNSMINMTNNGNNSILNMSSNRGLNTTMNFIKSITRYLFQCKEKLLRRKMRKLLDNLIIKVKENMNALN